MKVVILAGGRGTRIGEETEFRPKPLLEIGNMPILWHIMKTYAHYGFKDFVLCLGYKGYMIKEYFLNYGTMSNDFTLKLGNSKSIKFHSDHKEKDWSITFVETGLDSQTGSRVKKIEKFIDGDLFMLTYGDGVADLNIKELLKTFKSSGKIGVVTGVHPSSRFGELVIKENRVVKFTEKPQVKQGLINGGFFVFKRKFFEYLREDNDCFLEREPLEELASDGELAIYSHHGFWQCVDTRRELDLLNNLWEYSQAPWRVW